MTPWASMACYRDSFIFLSLPGNVGTAAFVITVAEQLKGSQILKEYLVKDCDKFILFISYNL
jgi:hypothetical protein